MNLREIDELVATKVFGWDIYSDNGNGEIVVIKNGSKIFQLPMFSNSIADAWRIIYLEFHVDIEKDNDKYYVCIHTGTTNPKCEYASELIYFAEAITAPLAICLAALKSVGVDIDVRNIQ